MTLRIGSLFTGYGGLDMAVESVLDAKVSWVCDVDPGASKVLAARYPDVPNLGDITAVDWDVVEPVDIICGGFPCTDLSAAGKRAGLGADTRSGLWAQMALAIKALRPSLVLIENVRGLLSGGDTHVEPTDTCLCGWTHRRGGMHRHLEEAGLLRHQGDRGHDSESAGNPHGVEAPVRRFAVHESSGDRAVGRSALLVSVRPGGGTDAAGDRGSSGPEAGTGHARHSARGHQSVPGAPPEWDGGLDGRSARAWSQNPGEDPGAECEGTCTPGSCDDCWSPTTCPACGRDVGDGPERTVFQSWMGSVLWDLANIGFDAEWVGLRASDIGAPHHRYRIFILAWPATDATDLGRQRGGAAR